MLEEREGRWRSRGPRTKRTRLILAIVLLGVLLLALVIYVLTRAAARRTDRPQICLTRDCIESAQLIQSTMDSAVDPCQDFYKFSCGNFLRKRKDPKFYENFSQDLEKEAWFQIKKVLEREPDPATHEDVRKMKSVYNTCIRDLSSTDVEPSVASLQRGLREAGFGDWPSILETWEDETRFSTEALLSIPYSFAVHPFFILKCDHKDYDTYVYKIFPNNADETSGRVDFMREILKLLKLPENVVHRTLADIEAVEREHMQILAATLPYPTYEAMDLPTLQELIPNSFNWTAFFQRIFERVGYEALAEDKVVVAMQGDRHLLNVLDLLERTPQRAIYNYLVWKFVLDVAPYVGGRVRQLRLELDMPFPALWRTCAANISPAFDKALTAEYARVMFNSKRESEVRSYLEAIKNSFKKRLPLQHWLDDKTKALCERKVDDLRVVLGYPPERLTDHIMPYFQGEVNGSSFFSLFLRMVKVKVYVDVEALNSTDKFIWLYHPAKYNAFNYVEKNKLILPIGVMFPPAFQFNRPRYLNFGGIGGILAHEMGHSFDNEGIVYQDSEDRRELWWDPAMVERFSERARCYATQYSAHVFHGQQWNGNQSLRDDLADQIALLHAYQAYLDVEASGGKEPGLPGLPYSTHQLFFIHFAQFFCATYSTNFKNLILSDTHSPGEFRVLGPIRNSPQFSEVFSCPPGSPMNPLDKCHLWI